MGKRKTSLLIVEPFPPLGWDDFFWTSTVLLEAWKGFQCRLGPYGARSAKKPSDGTTRLNVTSPNNDSQNPPSSVQAAAYRYLIAHQQTIRDSVLRAIFDEYPDYRAAYYEDYDLDETDNVLPVLDRPEQLRDLIGLSHVHIHNVVREEIAYVGYEFGCAWEEEHGLGVMAHRDRIVKVGGADVSILAWIAERDANRNEGKKVSRHSAEVVMKFKVALYPLEEGYGVNVPGLPGCWSQGATEEEALANIAEAIREYLDAEIDPTDETIIREIEVASMTWAHRIEAVLSEDGKLLIDDLPFRAGQTVEVIVLPVIRAAVPSPALRGTVLRYDQPTAPVAEADWGALQ